MESKSDRLLKYKEQFVEIKKKTGGVTGSAPVKDLETGEVSQLKPSILDNPSKRRRVKAYFTDRENFGEVIAASIGRALLGEDYVPEVSLVYDKMNKKVSVASKYLVGKEGGVRTLDDFATEENDVVFPKGARHVSFVAGNADKTQGQLSLDSDNMKPLKKSLAQALVVSAITGDHDVNPGNMLVVTNEQDKSRIARIDFGHAFNDLLRGPTFTGGARLSSTDNGILDFFNRPKLAGAALGGDESKLWRSYSGMIPSQDVVDALREMETNFARAQEGLDKAKGAFIELITEMEHNGDKDGIKHVKESLSEICKSVSRSKLDLNKYKTKEEVVDAAFNVISEFTKNQGENLRKVANVMQVQVDLDETLRIGKPLSETSRALLTTDTNFPEENGKIQWVKTAEGPAFLGSVEDYISHRSQQLSQEPSENMQLKAIATNYQLKHDLNEFKQRNEKLRALRAEQRNRTPDKTAAENAAARFGFFTAPTQAQGVHITVGCGPSFEGKEGEEALKVLMDDLSQIDGVKCKMGESSIELTVTNNAVANHVVEAVEGKDSGYVVKNEKGEVLTVNPDESGYTRS